MKVTAIIQARLGSTRLPGKVLKKVLNKPLLQYQVERIKNTKLIDNLIIATTTKEEDKKIIDFCINNNISYYCGSEEDVLGRYYEAASHFGAEVIVRLTSDCPLIDPNIIDKVIEYYLKNNDRFDYVSNRIIRTYPRGMDTEVFPFKVLEETYLKAKKYSYREHVTPYIYSHPERYRLGNIEHPVNVSKHRWTVDTEEDFELIKHIIEALYPQNPLFSMEDILKIIEQNPAWFFLNSHIEQKRLDID